AAYDLFIDLGENVAGSREESGDHGKTLFDRNGGRWLQADGIYLTCYAIESFRGRAPTLKRPDRVGEMLLYQRYFRLDRKFNITQICAVAAIWCNAGQDPGTPLLIHQSAGAVDRIEDNEPYRIRFLCPSRQDNSSILDALGDKDDRNL